MSLSIGVLLIWLSFPVIASADETFLGNLSQNQYDSDSITNPYGRYGNPYNSNSLTNRYGPYLSLIHI